MQSELQAKRAGKASFAEEELDDTPFGYQIMLGVDYALTDTPMPGLQERRVDHDSFSDRGAVWNPLRGHTPERQEKEVTGSP